MRTLLAILFALALTACSRSPDAPRAGSAEDPIRVVVTVPPLAWPANALWGDRAEVTVLLPADASPHHWELSPSDALAISRADVLLAQDEDTLSELLQAADEPTDITALSMHDDIVLLELCGRTENCGSEHPWLDPEHMLAFSTILDAWGVLEGDAEGMRETAYAQLPGYLPPPAGPDVLVLTTHDAWGEFFGWIGIADTEPLRNHHHHEPSPTHLADIRARALAAEQVLVVLEPGHPDPWLEDLAEEAAAAVVTLDPVGTRDWPADMKKRYEAVEAALESLE